MENLERTRTIVKDIIAKLEQVKKSTNTGEISKLERECVKLTQLAQMQFGYITRDIFRVVNGRRVELRASQDKEMESVDEAIAKAKKCEKTAKKPRKNVEKKTGEAKKSTKKGE